METIATRQLTSHRVNGLNESLRIEVIDEPGQGNACPVCCDINFQNGPIKEAGINGISVEALLAIVEDRLAGFASGQFATRENSIALGKVQEAMMWLHKRTRDRVARGVEGTNKL